MLGIKGFLLTLKYPGYPGYDSGSYFIGHRFKSGAQSVL